jgi:hypothetical protein
MDTGSFRIRKTVPRHTEKSPPLPETSTIHINGDSYSLVDIRATGDILLEVTFENRKSSSKLVSDHDASSRGGTTVKHTKSSNSKVLYRVRLDTLKKTSKYFELLLGSDKFAEGSGIAAISASLRLRDIVPSEAEPQDLPLISIIDDDDSTRIAGREAVFGDLLQILHGGDVTTRLTIPYLAILAVMADRFDCTTAVARYVKSSRRFPWPQTFGSNSPATEEVLRQKILISWLLDDPVKLASATRELILRGSLKWSGVEEHSPRERQATWWDIQDGLEGTAISIYTFIIG